MNDSTGERESAASSARRRRQRQGTWLRRGLIFLGCVLLLDGLFGDRGLAQSLRARQDLLRAAEGLTKLRRDNAALRDDVRRLRSDPATLEAVARRELGLIRRGEILILLKDAK